MKVGDLVTLSARAQNTGALWRWSTGQQKRRGESPLVGLIVETGKSERWHDSGRELFYIRWCRGLGPPGREGRTGYYKSKKDKGFWRTDLKFVSSARA